MTRVLIVDDSPTEMQLLTSIMEQHGYDVITADNGEEGVAMAKASLPDVILMDVVMPGMNGFQATRQISKAQETAHIPVIIITTKDQETDRIWGLRQGAKDFLTKPVQEGKLLTTVRSLV
jgi:twitching motility two-component system response regulator PilH